VELFSSGPVVIFTTGGWIFCGNLTADANMAKENREMVWLQCTETGDLNYRTELKVAGGAPKIELKKYSPRLRRHTMHKIKRK
jgi:large subunit ribosomal protein L33